MIKPPKRACPQCGGPVRIDNSTTLTKTQTYVERYQTLKCLECGYRGILTTKENIEWLSPK